MTRILVIDDSAALRRAVREALETAWPGVTVGEAEAALPGLALVGDERWDAVLLDLSLPDRGGVEALHEIRRLRPGLPVVVMSLHAEAEYGAAVRAAGAAAYVTKGSGVEALVTAVRSVLEGRTAPSAASAAPSPSAARILHDDIGQAIVAAKLDVQLAARAPDLDEARRLLLEAVRALDLALAAVRALTERLERPKP